MQSPVIPRVRAPSDLTQTSIAIVIGNQVFGVPAIELSGAFGFQPFDQGLTDIAGLAVTDGNFIVGNGTNWVAESGATARTSLGLGTAATQNTGTSGANVPLLNAANTWALAQTFSANPIVSGGGVEFPATQVASANANTLDDYEEGTFTPALSATGATFSYAVQSGLYTKVGRLVCVMLTFTLNTSGNTLTANTITATGLPFTAANLNFVAVSPVRLFSSTTSLLDVIARTTNNTTTVSFEYKTAAATSFTAAVANGLCHATAGTDIRFNLEYIV